MRFMSVLFVTIFLKAMMASESSSSSASNEETTCKSMKMSDPADALSHGRSRLWTNTFTKITTCLWLKRTGSQTENDVLFTYAYDLRDRFQVAIANDLMLLIKNEHEGPDNEWGAPINGNVNLMEWNHLCVSLNTLLPELKVYLDATELSPVAIEMGNTNPMLSGGVWVLGQDSDDAGNKFQEDQAFPGKLYDVQIYNYTLNATQVSSVYTSGLDCSATTVPEGNALKWSEEDWQPVGGAVMDDDVPCS